MLLSYPLYLQNKMCWTSKEIILFVEKLQATSAAFWPLLFESFFCSFARNSCFHVSVSFNAQRRWHFWGCNLSSDSATKPISGAWTLSRVLNAWMQTPPFLPIPTAGLVPTLSNPCQSSPAVPISCGGCFFTHAVTSPTLRMTYRYHIKGWENSRSFGTLGLVSSTWCRTGNWIDWYSLPIPTHSSPKCTQQDASFLFSQVYFLQGHIRNISRSV